MKMIDKFRDGARRLQSLSGPRRLLSLLCAAAFVSLSWTGTGHAQGCGGMMGSHGGGQTMTHETMESPQSMAPIWTNMMRSYAGMKHAVGMMSASDAQYYGGLLRDDFHSVAKTGKTMYPDVEDPLKSSSARIKQLTKQIQSDVKAHDSVAAATELARLDVEIGRVATLFPKAALPAMAESDDDAEATSTESSPSETNTTERHAVYVCPMHPEVKMSAPGDCPKCGMALKKVDG